MSEEIPQEQLEQIRPIVEGILSAFHDLERAMPLETESALVYVPDSQEQA